MSIEEYIEKFNNLTVQCQIDEGDYQLLTHYKTRLHKEIQHKMTLIRFYSIEEVYQMALKIEIQLKSPPTKRFGLLPEESSTIKAGSAIYPVKKQST